MLAGCISISRERMIKVLCIVNDKIAKFANQCYAMAMIELERLAHCIVIVNCLAESFVLGKVWH